jgi:hypothetical protein
MPPKAKPKKLPGKKPKAAKNKEDEEFLPDDEDLLVDRILARVADNTIVDDGDKPPSKKRKANSKSDPPAPQSELVQSPPPRHLWHPAETTVLVHLLAGCLPVTQWRVGVKATTGQYRGMRLS